MTFYTELKDFIRLEYILFFLTKASANLRPFLFHLEYQLLFRKILLQDSQA